MSRLSIHSLARSIALSLAIALLPSCAAVDDAPEEAIASQEEALKSKLPTIPEALAVPAGNRLAFTLHAEGVQIYDCKAGTDGALSWVFRAPEADLFRGRHPVGSHFAGPTWEAFDGSSVVGARLAGATVDSTAIPWLLLQASAHTGRGLMSSVTYIQRLETVAGLAPTTGCDASSAGAVAEIDYSATYAFYQATCGH